MTQAKVERLLNLTIALLATDRPLTRAEIRRSVGGYMELKTSDAAFERTFERDKNELRELGIPIEMVSLDAYFDNEHAYQIRREAYVLPPVEFSADEAAVLGVAGRAWREQSMAAATTSALTKLRSVGVEPDLSRLAALEPVVTAREPSFADFRRAVRERIRIEFTYRESRRTLETWALTSNRGRWYAVGRDQDRDAPRMFRLSRVSELRFVSKPGAYTIPDDLDLPALTQALDPPVPGATAQLAIRGSAAPSLRRRATSIAWPPQDQLASRLPEFDLYQLDYSTIEWLVPEIAAAGPDVVVVAPAELRNLVIGHLRRVPGVLVGAR